MGEIDLDVRPAGWTGRRALNYTAIRQVLGDTGPYAYHAPRAVFDSWVYNPNLCSPLAARLASEKPTSSNWTYPSSGLLGATCTNDTVFPGSLRSCLELACASFALEPTVAKVYAIDTAQEKRIGLGRAYTFGALQPGTALMRSGLATQMGLKVGDYFFLSIAVEAALPALFYDGANKHIAELIGSRPNETIDEDEIAIQRVNVPVRLAGIMASSFGKFASGDTKAVLVELAHVTAMLADAADPAERVPHASFWRERRIEDFVDRLALNLPPPRVEAYRHTDYDDIQRAVMEFSSRAVYLLGFNQLAIDQPIVESLRGSRFFALFLGLILNIILCILTGLSILLLYSLLIVNVEVRTFDMGVMRMLGMTKLGVLAHLLAQAFAYALPAYIVGMGVSQGLFFVLARFFERATAVEVSPWLARDGIILATILAFVIPIVAAVFPVVKAFGQSLVQALSVNQSKTSAVKVSIERSENGAFSWPMIVVGVCLAVFGFLIYYMLPLALISFNLSLLLYIFFGLLIGMIFGLALLALNVQHLLERLFVLVFVWWWETPAVVSVVLKNLVAHRLANRKTTLMYSVSLAVIIFISVSFSLQIQSFIYQTRQSNGALLVVNTPSDMHALESILESNPFVRDWAHVSYPLSLLAENASEIALTNIGQFFETISEVSAVSPNFFSVTLSGFLNVHSKPKDFSDAMLSELLYDSRGSHSLLVPTTYRTTLGLSSLDANFVQRALVSTPDGSGRYLNRMTPLAFVDSTPVFKFSKFPNADGLDTIASMPTLQRMAVRSGSLRDLPILKVLIDIPESLGGGPRDELLFQLRRYSVVDYRSEVEPLKSAEQILGYFFIFTTAVAMTISFFSLSSSMFSNIHKQKKEIAVLRALGATRWRMRRIYVIEAFVLVFSSAFAGIVIGTMVAWTMVLQRILFVQLPIPFVFPWPIMIIVLIVSAFSALASSLAPIHRLVGKPIVYLFRSS